MVQALKIKYQLALLCLIFSALNSLWPAAAKAEVLFEGYAKVLNDGMPCGYYINRYEYDVKKKQFISISFLKTNQFGGNITESWKATSDANFKPLAYEYTSLSGTVAKTIDAKFTAKAMTATVKDGATTKTIKKDLPKGVFLSSFLAYVMLKSPSGIKPDTKYEYKAIAEEDADIYSGVAYVKQQEQVSGIKSFRILNEFKNVKFVSYVTERGEVLSTKSPANGITTELVSTPKLATLDLSVPTDLLSRLFGNVPTGVANELTKLAQAPGTTVPLPTDTPLPSTTPGKKFGVPAGQGIFIKTQKSMGGQDSTATTTTVPPN